MFRLQTCLLCIMGEFAGGGSVAVGISDRWQVTGDTVHMTRYTWHVTCDIWYVTCDRWHMTCDTYYVTPDMWQMIHSFIFLFLLFLSIFSSMVHLHRSRDSVSPVSRIFFNETTWNNQIFVPFLFIFCFINDLSNKWPVWKKYWTVCSINSIWQWAVYIK